MILSLNHGLFPTGSGFGKRSKVLSLTGPRTFPICIIGQNVEGVDLFIYLGRFIFTDSDTELDVTRGIRSASVVLSKIHR